MTTSRFSPPFDYLQAASRASLQSFELARLNHAANLRQEIAALIDQWIQETSEAVLARWMLDHHSSLQPATMNSADIARSFLDPSAHAVEESHSLAKAAPAPPRLAERRSATRGSMPRRLQNVRSQI